jgi:hypothetical protein
VEGREHRDTGTFEGKMAETRGSTTVSTKLERGKHGAHDLALISPVRRMLRGGPSGCASCGQVRDGWLAALALSGEPGRSERVSIDDFFGYAAFRI